ncbi:uncharacterized protein TNCV_2188071 [Trichonephila clavipes]|nr:uncharacterized protein TNCV_2188071 [Trichonephila clavipes]
MVSWEYLWPTLRCRREAGASPLLSIGWWYLSSVSPKRHCCRVSAADKGCRVYPLDPRPDAVSLYSGCTPGQKNNNKKKDNSIIPTKHLILTFNSPTQPKTIKAGYLNCKIHPYFPNPLRCFKCQRFGHSQTSSHGQLTCSRCASVGHSSSNCTLEPKCVNCSQSHPSDSKLCQKWKLEKQIQEIKTNKNISYFEARKLIVSQLTQTYAQATKPSTISTTTQTDPNITNIICPPLQCLKPVSSENPMPSTSSSVSTVSTSSSSTQEHLLPSPSAIIPTIQSIYMSLLKIPISTTTTTTSPGNNLNTSVSSLETETRSLTTPNKFAAHTHTHTLSIEIQPLPESVPTTSNSKHSNAPEIPQCVKRNSRNRRKRPKVQKPEIEIKMAPHRPRKSAPTEYATDEEDMITYHVEEEKLEPDPTVKFTLKESPTNYPKGYLRALTPTRFRKSRS